MLQTFVPVLILLALVLVGSWYLFPAAWAETMLWFARLAARMKVHETRVDQVKWRWLEGGHGPNLVLLHGFAAEGDHWLAVARELHREFHLLAPDLPGFGHSETPAELTFDIPTQARRVWAWLDHCGIDQCILAGNSMGGWIAAECAAQQPDRVQALWLQDPLGVSGARVSDIVQRIEKGERNPFAIASTRDYHLLADDMFVRKPPSLYPLMKTGGARVAGLLPHLDRLQSEILGSPSPIEALAPRLQMPVLVQWGEQDRAVDVSGAGSLEKALNHVEVHIQPQVGHLPMLETPIQSARLIRQFSQTHGLLPGQGAVSL